MRIFTKAVGTKHFRMYQYIKVIITVSILLIPACEVFAQTNNNDSMNKKMNLAEDVFARQVFTAFQSNNEALYESMQPTNEEYKALLQLMLNANVKGLTQEKIDEMIKRRKGEASERMKKDFNEFQQQADSVGIIWTNAVYQNYDWQEMYPEEIHQKYLYGTIWFAINGVRYMIEDVQAVELPAGYKLQKIYRIRKSEE